ncbi:MAG: recG [Patescibacteria group bacterium]|jgi:ATP-dependent DNA helicase RecG|nr:recG [Patescibacteria group bacterium]
MYSQSDPVGVINGVGDVARANLEKLGIRTINDLLQWYPRDYLDASNPTPVAKVPFGRLVAVQVTVQSVESRRTKNRNLQMLEAVCGDESGALKVRWFNQSFLKQKLKPGSVWIFIGSVNRFQGESIMMGPIIEERPRILSIYAQTKGLTSRMLRGYLDWVLKNVDLKEGAIPEEITLKEELLAHDKALLGIHQPENLEEREVAFKQLAFEEAFWFFVRMALSRREVVEEKGIPIQADAELLKELVGSLPFELTPGQKRSVWDMVQEMGSGHPMTRLLNGDVGSGKTVVAALLAAVVAKSGYRTALLVPTEILAKQHYESVKKLLENHGVGVSMWTAAQKDALEGSNVIIGTHALLHKKEPIPDLGLVIIDEQHRFGVKQRHLLRQNQEQSPHMLSMTATPIPRTLALALYSDLAVSILPDKPKNRLPVLTRIVHSEQRAAMYQKIEEELTAGHQVFVLCPLIEEAEKKEEVEGAQFTIPTEEEQQVKEKKTVLAEVERLRKEFPHFGTIEAVHGKMKADEKRKVMERMSAGEIQVLVSTSVIEVGVDVPNATIMVIEGAERFGLAQLHQLRGRVGRGSSQSYCFLCPSVRSQNAMERLQVLVESDSGFELAEADLALRGPGEMIGSVQSGLPDFRMASLTDVAFLQRIKAIVDEYSKAHPEFLQQYAKIAYSNELTGLE